MILVFFEFKSSYLRNGCIENEIFHESFIGLPSEMFPLKETWSQVFKHWRLESDFFYEEPIMIQSVIEDI